MDERTETGGGGYVGGNAETGRDFTGRDDRSVNVYPSPPATPDNFGWWLADIRDSLIDLRAEQRHRLGSIEAEQRTQDRHLSKLTSDVAELKEIRHSVAEIRHRVEQLMQMEPELREDFGRDLRDLRSGFSFHFTLLWLANAFLLAGVFWALFVK